MTERPSYMSETLKKREPMLRGPMSREEREAALPELRERAAMVGYDLTDAEHVALQIEVVAAREHIYLLDHLKLTFDIEERLRALEAKISAPATPAD